ncbi:DUF6881 domain-containing protein [Streptomyces sp. NPDC017260]|uniref:DUF6881 domain-containing protein n=1 Tax=unclassified Streptomyces TaxID=2593676 RepID=UPI00379F4422
MDETGKCKLFPDTDPRYPLCHIQVAMHLGIPVFRSDEAAENLRRTKALIATYRELGITLLTKGEEKEPFTEDDVTPELIAEHEGQQSNFGKHTPASFDDHLLDIVASQTGKPRVTRIHIRKETPRIGYPIDVYQEIDDKTGAERRRVEVYLDGRHLWVTANYEGTGETEKDDTRYPGLGILNDRPGQRAWTISEPLFEEMWERATDESCGWATGADVCPNDHTEGSPFCPVHAELARRMFPRLFETA